MVLRPTFIKEETKKGSIGDDRGKKQKGTSTNTKKVGENETLASRRKGAGGA